MQMRKTGDQWRAEAQQLRAELETLYEASQGEGLDKDQQARFDSLISEESPIAKCEAQARHEDKIAAKMAEFAAQSRAQASAPVAAFGPSKAAADEPKAKDDGRILLKGQRSRFFNDAREAKAAAEWFAYATSPTSEARNFHATQMQKFGGEYYNAQSIGTDGKGGYLVPEPIATEIIKNRDAIGQVAALCNTITMGQETLRINEEASGTTVYYPGESGSITASDLDWVQHTLTVTKRAALVKMSREFIADANVSAADQIIDRLSYDFAYTRDNEIINGDGTSTYGGETGLVSGLDTTYRKTATGNLISELTLAEFNDVKKLLKLQYREGASWVFGRDVWGQVEALALAAGGTTAANYYAGMEQMRFLGFPVVLTEQMPVEANSAVVAFLGNYRKAVAIGDRNDMTIDTSTERYFETDDVAIRATHRYDILVHNNDAYASLRLAAS